MDAWWGLGADRLHDQLVQFLTAHGQRATESVTAGAEGEVIQSAHVVFMPSPEMSSRTPNACADCSHGCSRGKQRRGR